MVPSMPAANSSNPPPANGTPACSVVLDMPSTRLSISHSHPTSVGRAGNRENPQLPVMTVVIPCHDEGEAVGSKCSWAS